MKILVTGAAGFIGVNLVTELENAGHKVIRHDRARGAHVVGDLLHPGHFAEVLDSYAPDAVVHLAAQVGRLFSENDATHAVRANAEMSAIVARACWKADRHLVYVSTSEVYGDQGAEICDERRGPFEPHGIYGLTKWWGEQVSRHYCAAWLTIVRLSMPYGPGAPPGHGRRALDNMLWQAHTRQPIPVHRNAERSWCWIDDTVRGIRVALEHDHREGGYEAYNIGRDDDPRTMLEIAERACEITGAPRELITMLDAPPMQTVVKRLATERLRALGWKPFVQLDEGIPRVLDWVARFDAEGRMK